MAIDYVQALKIAVFVGLEGKDTSIKTIKEIAKKHGYNLSDKEAEAIKEYMVNS